MDERDFEIAGTVCGILILITCAMVVVFADQLFPLPQGAGGGDSLMAKGAVVVKLGGLFLTALGVVYRMVEGNS
jgi:hypothetical protein